jgi:hypothetical protein
MFLESESFLIHGMSVCACVQFASYMAKSKGLSELSESFYYLFVITFIFLYILDGRDQCLANARLN